MGPEPKMQEIKHCKTCKHWRKHAELGYRPRKDTAETYGGFCTSDRITEAFGPAEYEQDMLIYPYNEGVDYFWTGPEFGCVHHSETAKTETIFPRPT